MAGAFKTWQDASPLWHYAHALFELDRDRAYQHAASFKPGGFWISDDSGYGWPDWCRDNDFRLSKLRTRYLVRLAAPERLVWLSSQEQLLAFHSFWQPDPDQHAAAGRMAIDWPAVAREWAGIVITPYIAQMRFDDRVPWYYDWDCASGCIWDLSVIDTLEEDSAWDAEAFLSAVRADA